MRPVASLTPEQAAIVETGVDGPSVVDAGAGTGKTYTLVRRAVHLVANGTLEPERILIVTFMRKAAIEVGDRLTSAFQELGRPEVPLCTTVHALAASLVREFAYEAGLSPDVRGVDDFRARGIFSRAYDDLLHGRLGVRVDDLPLLERGEVFARSLATAALDLKNRGLTVERFERDALAAAEALGRLPYGQLWSPGARANTRRGCDPRVELTPEQRRAEAAREANNVRAVAALFRRFDELLRRESLLTYGDLLSRAASMIEGAPAIATRLRRRWLHVMVDEFQDTNPQQLRLLRAIFGDALVPVMAVGDVRQAIFEWNGADPDGIRRIARADGVRVFALTRNRRSPQQVLDLAHDVLPKGERERSRALVAHAGPADGVVLRHAAFGGTGSTAEHRENEAAAIALEIRRLLADGTPRGEIAVLLRSRTHARVYTRALARLGIGAKTHGGTGFYDAPEIRDGVAWLRLITDPTDAFALTRVLESPVIGLSAGTTARLFDGGDAAPHAFIRPLPAWLTPLERERLQRLREIVARLGAAVTASAPEAVRAVVRETGIDLARETADPASAPQIRANVAKLVALATGFANDRPLAGLADLLAEIDERDALEIDESEAELGGDEIAVMTIHSAKGLEWDYVFLANVADSVFPSRAGRSDDIALVTPAGALALRYDTDGCEPFRWTLLQRHDPATGEFLSKPEKDEERRLFYVALTRAKRALWVSGAHRSAPGKFLAEVQAFCAPCAGAAAFGDAPADAPAPHAPQPFPADDERLMRRLAREPLPLDVPRPKLSYSAISTYALCPRQARYRYVLRVPDLRDERGRERTADGDADPPVAPKLDPARYGNVVHLALESLVHGAIDGEPASVDDAVARALDEFDLAADRASFDRTSRAVTHAWSALSAFTPLAAEAEFTRTIAGETVGGFIDLIARDANGRVTIIDYKTGRVPDEGYALQLALYRMAVADVYPDAATAILRIADDASSFSSPALPSDADVVRLVAEAASPRDEPRPGESCRTCPYAGALCPEGVGSA